MEYKTQLLNLLRLHSFVILKNETQNYLHDLTRRHASVQLDHDSFFMCLDICINKITSGLIIRSTFMSKSTLVQILYVEFVYCM